MTKQGKLAAGGLAALLASAIGCSAALAADRNIDPDMLPPAERNFALHGPLGDVGPSGRAAPMGCRWSRLQIPTANGLRWVAHEECDDGGFGR
jgi:hypothetical protein